MKSPQAKGSNFERLTGQKLSMWLTQGQHDNIMNRNVLSGGMHTRMVESGDTTRRANIPGDLMAAHPDAFSFCSLFSVECKHRQSLDLDVFMFDKKGTSFLSHTIVHTAQQASNHGLHWMVVARQNRGDIWMFVNAEIGAVVLKSVPFVNALRYHTLHNEKYMMFSFDQFLRLTDARRFMAAVRASVDEPQACILPVTAPAVRVRKKPQPKRRTTNA